MEELKLLIEMVSNLPQMALWVMVGFFSYKVIVIGSTYGVIRLIIIKLHDVLVNPKRKEVRPMIKGEVIHGTMDSLLKQISRIKDKGCGNSYGYIHQTDVDWLTKAIDDKIAKDKDDCK